MNFISSIQFIKIMFWVFLAGFFIYNGLMIFRYFMNRKNDPMTKKSIALKLGKWPIVSKILGLVTSLIGIIIINFFLVSGTLATAGVIYSTQPKVIMPNSPSLEATEVSMEKPFKIIFDRPININTLEKNISPDLAGEWKFANTGFLFAKDTIIFIPEKSTLAGERYTITLKNIQPIIGSKSEDYLLSFATPPLPNIKLINPATGTEGILPNQEIYIETDTTHESIARLDFKFIPETSLNTKIENGTKYVVSAKDGFKKSTTYNFEIFRTPITKNFKTGEVSDAGETELIAQSNFRTLEAPGVADYGPKGSGIMPETSIWVEFRQDMDKTSTESAFSVSNGVTGTKSWEGNRKLIFKPNNLLTKNTSYIVSVSKDAKAGDGSPFEDNFSFTFVTIGHVAVSSFYPGNNASGVSLSTKISVTFNQAIDHASAESKFSISPNPGGSFSWSGNTLSLNHGGLGYVTKYTINVGSDIKTIYGLDSVQNFSSTFTTQQQSIMLNVPSYHQAHMYSCMASAARSALAYKGAYVSEDHLLSLIGYDNTPFSGTWGDPNAIWGNPYSGVVGNIDGRSGGVNWGYGAYWGPTASAIGNYRSNEVKTGWNVAGIASEIAAGNPVIVWWVNGVWPAYEVFWKTTSGTSIRGVNSMHVQVVKGFTGTVDNPTSFTVTDSGYGYPSRTFDINTFKAKWSWFGNSAVIVR